MINKFTVGDPILYLYKDYRFFFFPRLIDSMYRVATFNYIGFPEVLKTIYYFLSALSFQEYLFIFYPLIILILSYKDSHNLKYLHNVYFFLGLVLLQFTILGLVSFLSFYLMYISYQTALNWAKIVFIVSIIVISLFLLYNFLLYFKKSV
jgi:hypothetical protein